MNVAPEQAKLRSLDHASAILASIAIAMLLVRYGLPALDLPHWLVLAWSALLPIGLFIESLVRLLVVRDPLRYMRRHPLRYAVLLMILLELSGVAGWSVGGALRPTSASFIAGEAYLAIFLLAFAGSWAKGLIAANRWLANRRIPVLALAPLSFALAILVGSLLLALPGLQRQPIAWIDSLFTATSAICVTGLMVYDVSTALTPVGQLLLALLIQLGGMGIITVLGMLALWRGGARSAGERVAFGELVGGLELRQTRRLIGTVAKVVLSVELVGALLLWLLWRRELPHALPLALFHAVSAFCNAGFSLFSDSFASFACDAGTLSVLMVLIVAGGIGAPVIGDVAGWAGSRLAPWTPERRLRKASQFVLGVTLGLIVAGALAIWLDARLAERPTSLLAAVFQSVTTRTAGFQVESQLNLGMLGLWATVLLMMIGASPQSTGGGIKTSILARAFLRVENAEGGSTGPLRRPLGIVLLLAGGYAGTGVAAGFLLAHLEHLPAEDALFEALSALGTVGLSRDVTPQLGLAAKLLVIVLMFAGRVLYPTWVLHVVKGSRPGDDPVAWI